MTSAGAFKPELQGIRAIAVILVFFYHANTPFFDGGYIGVDIFLVLSGYLITGILLRVETINFASIFDFYKRRFFRLYPALLFVLAVTLAFSFILLPDEQVKLAKSALSAALNVSNIYFWRSAGYFDALTDYKPLIHTWSLAVEWQFYIGFPLIFLFFKSNSSRLVVLSIVFVISLAIAERASVTHPVPNFYLPVSRAWEFIAGGLIHFFRVPKFRFRSILNLLSLATIFISVVLFHENVPFPSLLAVPVVFATCVLIALAHTTKVYSRLLTLPPLLFLGNISYSFYLIHQPMLSYARHLNFNTTDLLTLLTLGSLSVALAWLSYSFIEASFRGTKVSSGATIRMFGVVPAFIALLATVTIFQNGFPERIKLYDKIEYRSLGHRLAKEGFECNVDNEQSRYNLLDLCFAGDETSSKIILAYGDSHLESLQWALAKQADAKGWKIYFVEINGCGVIFDITAKKGNFGTEVVWDRCNQGFQQLKDLKGALSADVLLVSRWTFQFFPSEHVRTLAFDNTVGGVEKDLPYREYRAITETGELSFKWTDKANALRKLVNGLSYEQSKVFVLGPIPEIGWDIFRENLRKFRETGSLIEDLAFPYEAYIDRNVEIIKELQRIANSDPNIHYIDPSTVLCDTKQTKCFAQKAYVPLYLDDDHLSDVGANLLVEKIFDITKWQ